MAASPADVAKYTNDGVVVAARDNAIKANHVDARDLGEAELEMFFDSAVVAQALLDEKFDYLSRIGGPHEGIEVEESLGLGTEHAVYPSVPCFTIVDETRGINEIARTRAYAHDLSTDRYSVEVV